MVRIGNSMVFCAVLQKRPNNTNPQKIDEKKKVDFNDQYSIIVFGNRGVRKIKKMPIRKDKIILTDIDGCVLDWEEVAPKVGWNTPRKK